MNAMLQQLSPRTVITKFEQIAAASSSSSPPTCRPPSSAGSPSGDEGAQQAGEHRVVRAADDQHRGSDIDKIHAMVERAIEKSQAKDEAPDATAASDKPKKNFARSRGTTVGGSIGSYSEGYAANAANDLSSAC